MSYRNIKTGGRQQLAAIARAVVAGPRLILANGPTGRLHSRQGKEIMDLFTRLHAEGTTIIQVTHSQDYAAYGERITHLKDGWMAKADSDQHVGSTVYAKNWTSGQSPRIKGSVS